MRGRVSKSAVPLRRQILFQTSLCFLRVGFYQADGVPLIRPSVRTGAPSPEGKALAWCNYRGPYNHQGSALEARKQGNCHPLASVSRTRLRHKRYKTPHNRIKRSP